MGFPDEGSPFHLFVAWAFWEEKDEQPVGEINHGIRLSISRRSGAYLCA